MRHADALSRNAVKVLSVQEGRSGLIYRVRKAQEDQKVKKIMDAVYAEKKKNFTLAKSGCHIAKSIMAKR